MGMQYNPGISYRGDAHIAQGQTAMWQSMGDLIKGSIAEHKKAKAYKTMAVDALGMDPEQVDKMSLAELEGTIQGVSLKNAQAEEARRAELFAQHQAERGQSQAFNANIEQMMTDAPRGGGAAPPGSELARMMGSQGAPPAQQDPEAMMLSAQRLIGAAAKAGVLTPELVQRFMQNDGSVRWDQLKPREFTTSSGLRGVYGKGGQFQFDPGQFMEDGMQTVPVLDAEGNKVGERIRTGPSSTAAMPKAKEPKALPEAFFKRYHDLQDELGLQQSMLGKSDEELKQRGAADPKAKREQANKAAQQAQRQLQEHLKMYESQGYATPDFWQERRKTAGGEAAKQGTPAGEKPLTADLAKRFLAEAKGDKAKARELAKKQGYTF